MNVKIRAATLEDHEPIAKVGVLAWQEAYSSIFPHDFLQSLSWQKRAKGRADFINKELRKSLVAEQETQIIGFSDFGSARVVANIPEIDASCAEVYAIYVLPAYKFQGIGTQMLTTIQESLILDGFKKLIVWTLIDNQPAIKFYQKFGFQETVWRKKTNIAGNDYQELALIKLL
jgi:ribosomal protein S18 acetylase RimI-like enzyme